MINNNGSDFSEPLIIFRGDREFREISENKNYSLLSILSLKVFRYYGE